MDKYRRALDSLLYCFGNSQEASIIIAHTKIAHTENIPQRKLKHKKKDTF